MNRQTVRMVAGANLVAGCLLLQGCGMFGKKPSEQGPATIPEESITNLPPTTATSLPPEPAQELPSVPNTTAYTIQKNDTISAIAYRFNVRWQDVMAVNPGIVPTKLRVGQVIQLPGQVDVSKSRAVPAPTHRKVTAPKVTAPKEAAVVSGPMTTYVVKSGDSLSLIAHKHGVKTAALRAANSLTSDKIVVGQKLKVPGATKKVAEAPVKTEAKKAAVTAPKTTPPQETSKVEEPPAPVTPPPTVESPVAVAPTPETAQPTTAAPTESANVQTYTVKEGEDVYAVAIRWGVSPSDLKALNNLTSNDLKAGTVLKIPAAQ